MLKIIGSDSSVLMLAKYMVSNNDIKTSIGSDEGCFFSISECTTTAKSLGYLIMGIL